MSTTVTAYPEVVSQDEWLAARKELLAKEKEMTKAIDGLSASRRRLPMVKIDKGYEFDGPNGKVRLLDLFEGRRQLIVYHFMFDPNDPPEGKHEPYDEGCSGCSFAADQTPHLAHLHARDTTYVLVSRAPLSKIEPFKKRMGWTQPWYSSFGSDFNYDFHTTIDESKAPVEYNFISKAEMEKKGQTYHLEGEQPGLSVFLRDENGNVFHTYSAYGRGLEPMLTTYHLLDLTPFGRQEPWEDSPEGWPKTDLMWVRHHDKYAEGNKSSCCH